MKTCPKCGENSANRQMGAERDIVEYVPPVSWPLGATSITVRMVVDVFECHNCNHWWVETTKASQGGGE